MTRQKMAANLLILPSMSLKFALRSLSNNPGFTILAVLVIALGIGANTAMFSIVNEVLLKPLAYRDADRIVTIRNYWRKEQDLLSRYLSAPDFHDLHDQSTVFEAMAYYQSREVPVVMGTTAEYRGVAPVSREFFRAFEVAPIAGRLFSAEEQKAGAPATVLISYAYWQSRFGGNPRALGQVMRVFDKPAEIIGILPPGFQFPEQTDVWLPYAAFFEENTHRSGHNYFVIARLQPGATLAQTQMTSIAASLERRYRASNEGKDVIVTRLHDEMVEHLRLTLSLLLGAVGLVLLIACANGFQPEHVLLMQTTVPASNDEAGDRKASQFFKRLLPEVSALPGVLASGRL